MNESNTPNHAESKSTAKISLNDIPQLNKHLKTKEQALAMIIEQVSPITQRFTKNFEIFEEDEKSAYHYILVEFSEPKVKKPVPAEKARIIFRVNKSQKKSKDEHIISFKIEHEAVFFNYFNTINLNYFETLIDRIIQNKRESNKTLILATNFENGRIVDLEGQKIKYYHDEEAENILVNNNSEYFTSDENFNVIETATLFQHIMHIWKALNVENTETINYEKFERIFFFGKLNISPDKIKKLWNYTDKTKKGEIDFSEFCNFLLDLLHCLRAYHIACQKEKNNKFIQNKIKTCLEIMFQHFKEYDYDENQEISFENLKKCLEKENDLFSRRDIEIILKQINPNNKFEYWKFDKILKILFVDNFNYNELIKSDKIYKYLIEIFSRQDTSKNGKILYSKMKYALKIEDKIKMNKNQILIILNFFTREGENEIDYYKASIIIRNIVEEIFCSNLVLQKLEFADGKFHKYTPFEDSYDSYKEIQKFFIQFDEDYDHILNKYEFKNFLKFLLPNIDDQTADEIFVLADTKKDKIITFPEFKDYFGDLIQMTRIKNVLEAIAKIN